MKQAIQITTLAFILFLFTVTLAGATEIEFLGIAESDDPIIEIVFNSDAEIGISETLLLFPGIDGINITDGCREDPQKINTFYCYPGQRLLPGTYTLLINAYQIGASQTDFPAEESFSAKFVIEANDLSFWIENPRTRHIMPSQNQLIAVSQEPAFTISAKSEQPAHCKITTRSISPLSDQETLGQEYDLTTYSFTHVAADEEGYARDYTLYLNTTKSGLRSSLFDYQNIENNMYSVICKLHPDYRLEDTNGLSRSYTSFKIFVGYDTTPPQYTVTAEPETLVDTNNPFIDLSITATGQQKDFLSCSLTTTPPSNLNIHIDDSPSFAYNSETEAGLLSNDIVRRVSFYNLMNYFTLNEYYSFDAELTCQNPAGLMTTTPLNLPVELTDGILLQIESSESYYRESTTGAIIFTDFSEDAFAITSNMQAKCTFTIADEDSEQTYAEPEFSTRHVIDNLNLREGNIRELSVYCSAGGGVQPVEKTFTLYADTKDPRFTENNVINIQEDIDYECGETFSLHVEKPDNEAVIKYKATLYDGEGYDEENIVAGPKTTTYSNEQEQTITFSKGEFKQQLSYGDNYLWAVQAIDIRGETSSPVVYFDVMLHSPNDPICEGTCRISQDCSEPNEFCNAQYQCETGIRCSTETNNCAPGSFCNDDRFCQKGCEADYHCGSKFLYCDTLATFSCQSFCKTDADCNSLESTFGAELYCIDAQEGNGRCVAYCEEGSCAAGQYCDLTNPSPTCKNGCLDSEDCGDGQYCEYDNNPFTGSANPVGTCSAYCTDSTDCIDEARPYCNTISGDQYEGYCQTQCHTDEACGDGAYCGVNGECIQGCVPGSCEEGTYCNTNTNPTQCDPLCSSDENCTSPSSCNLTGQGTDVEAENYNPLFGHCIYESCIETEEEEVEDPFCSGYCLSGSCNSGCQFDTNCDISTQYCQDNTCQERCSNNMDCAPSGFCYTVSSTSTNYQECVSFCSTDLDCGSGQFCTIDGVCQEGCFEDEHCGNNRYCNPFTNSCQQECYRNSDCQTGYCDPGLNQCVSYCSSDEQCGDGKYCNNYGTCVTGCSTTSDCQQGLETCSEGRCVVDAATSCSKNTDCYGTDICVDRMCEPGTAFVCASDTDCRYDEYCSPAHTCEPIRGDCHNDEDCWFNEYCSPEHTCESLQGSCEDSSDCHYTSYCESGECRAYGTTQCMSDVDCAYDARCNQGNCESVAPKQCITQDDCAYNQYCTEEGSCVAIEGSCQTTSDCAYDEYCENLLCKERDTSCATANSCQEGETCAEGKCVPSNYQPQSCTEDIDCAYDEYCSSYQTCEQIVGECTKDNHCAYDAYCTDDNECEPLPGICADDSDCSYNRYCSTANKCVSYGSRDCVNDADCERDEYCSGTGSCKAQTNECYDHYDCKFNEFCNSANKCETIPGDCYTDMYCMYNQYCTDSFECKYIEGECRINADCRNNEYCENNLCKEKEQPEQQTCSSDLDCELGYDCVDGSCEKADECKQDSDCPDEDNICTDNGVCEYVDSCSKDEDCIELEYCSVNGICKPEALLSCESDYDCLSTEYCDTATSLCKELEGICDFDTDCSEEGEFCIDGQCQVFENTGSYLSGDNDNDGLRDQWEMDFFETLDEGADDDYDGDGVSNLYEFIDGTDPTDATDYRVDSDNDNLPDYWEERYFGNLEEGPNDDYDNDGKSNLQEYLDQTNPAESFATSEYECESSSDCLSDERCSRGECVPFDDNPIDRIEEDSGSSLTGIIFIILGILFMGGGIGYIYYAEMQRIEMQKNQSYQQSQMTAQQRAQMEAQRREREAKYAEYMKKKRAQEDELKKKREEERIGQRKSVFDKFGTSQETTKPTSAEPKTSTTALKQAPKKEFETTDDGYVELGELQKKQKGKDSSKRSALDELEDMVTTNSKTGKARSELRQEKEQAPVNKDDVFSKLDSLNKEKKDAKSKQKIQRIDKEISALKNELQKRQKRNK